MSADNPVLTFILPGEQDYRSVWEIQRQRVKDVLEGRASETIYFLEHRPVYTLGFHGNIDNLLVTEKDLQKEGIEIIRIERGGDITYHGPGQLVVYPIINLIMRKIGVKHYVDRLEQSVIDTCAELGISTVRIPGATGVWCGSNPVSAKKICAIGVKVTHGVTMHGLAFNITTDLDRFRKINPCGFDSSQVTSVKEQLKGQKIDKDGIITMLRENLLKQLSG